MQFRSFGKINFKVSAVSFGGGAVSGASGGYGFGPIDESSAIKLLQSAYELGINLFDTAPIYGFSESEQRIGKAFKNIRDKVFYVSKAGVTWDDRKRVRLDTSPPTVERMLEQSLTDLQTDYIDLYMLHWPDPKVDVRMSMEVLANAKKQGKIKYIGLSNTDKEHYQQAKEVETIDVIQNEFNLFLDDKKLAAFELVDQEQLGFMSYGTLDKGILTGHVTQERKFDQTDSRARAPWWVNVDRTPKYNAVKQLKQLLEQEQYNLLELALGYVLSHQQVSTALCGAKSLDQLNTLILALKHLPPREVIDKAIGLVKQQLALTKFSHVQ